MRPRHLVPCAAAVAALATVPSGAGAATLKCPPREGVQVTYDRRSGAPRVTCNTAFRVLFAGILNRRPPAGWSCRQPAARAWPVVETCTLRRKGRTVVTARLLEIPDAA